MTKLIHDENFEDRQYTYKVEKKTQDIEKYLTKQKEHLKKLQDDLSYKDYDLGEDIAPTIVGMD